jgi:predicted ATPase/class 3 adenylate cyclase/DNA-binding CsgD family transcriptional regulator
MTEPYQGIETVLQVPTTQSPTAGLPGTGPDLDPDQYRRVGLPIGTVTFLLSELAPHEVDSQNDDSLFHFEDVLGTSVASHGGLCLRSDTESDARTRPAIAVFSRASDAVLAAQAAQLSWRRANPTTRSHTDAPEIQTNSVRVRMTIHTGEAQLRNASVASVGYVGSAIRRATRLHQLGNSGQVLVSSASRDLALDQLGGDVSLDDLGEHRLKDLARSERVYQLRHQELPTSFPRLRSLDAFPNNLPERLSTFIGRNSELAKMGELLEEHRLVTIVGSGGAGKTQLALQSAAEHVGEHPDGVWWVELAPLTDPDAVVVTVAAVLGVSLRESRSRDRALTRALCHTRALIVFDNCEHVHDEVGRLILLLLENCPHLQIVATSRSPLDVPGELTWRVPPLAVPDRSIENIPLTVERLSQYESVQLFVDRARIARSTFALSNANGADVAEICCRVDGIPLAIELAAARTKTLLPSQISAGLDDALRLLSCGSRLLLPRQQTLEASIRWSVALLDHPARLLLLRLSVFSGSFDLTAAESVCAGDVLHKLDVLAGLEQLVDQSLITPLDGTSEGRFAALETVRQFGMRQLDEASSERLRQRHAEYFVGVAGDVAPRCETSEQFLSVEYLRAEIDNIRTTLNFLRERNEDIALASLVISLGPFWDVGGDKFEGATWSTKALGALTVEPSRERARLLSLRAECRLSLGEWEGCVEDCHGAIDIAAAVGDAYALGRANSTFTSILSFSGSLEQWRTQWAKTVALQRDANDLYGLAGTLTWGAVPLLRRGYVKEAAALFQQARKAIEALGSPGLLASQQYWEGLSAIWEGRPTEAERLALRALNSKALGSAPRIAGAESVLWRARSQLGRYQRSAEEYGVDEGSAEDRGEHLAANVSAMRARAEAVRRNPAQARAEADEWLGQNREMPTFDRLETMAIGTIASLRLGDLDDTVRRSNAIFAEAEAAGSVLYGARSKIWRATVHLLRLEIIDADRVIREAIGSLWENGLRLFLSEAVELLAISAAQSQDNHDSARLFGAVSRIRHDMQSLRSLSTEKLRNDAVESVSSALGTAEFTAAFDAGAALDDEELIAWIERTRGARGRPTFGWDSLTPTELHVAELVREGLTNREIAQRLFIGSETVKTHMSRIFAKLDIAKRSQLAALASRPNK